MAGVVDIQSVNAWSSGRRLPKEDKERNDREWSEILAAFKAYLDKVRRGGNPRKEFEQLSRLRAKYGAERAFEGFGMSWDDAIALINKTKGFTADEKKRRKVLVAAIDNVVDFSVAEQYQMLSELDELGIDEWEDDDLEALCETYNKRYAATENQDIEYSMIVAAAFCTYRDDTVLMYMTMGDERVRPWHLAHEGFSAPASVFPEWLIPPIEHRCRCFLVDVDWGPMGAVQAMKEPEMPDWFDRTFKESVAKGGRIFSDEHPYFKVKAKHKAKLREVAEMLKKEFYDEAYNA